MSAQASASGSADTFQQIAELVASVAMTELRDFLKGVDESRDET